MNRKRIFDLLKVGVSILLIVFLLKQIGLEQTVDTLAGANLYYLCGALVLFLLGIGLRAYRWQVLLISLGVEVPLEELTALYFVGFFFNNVLPSGFGGDVVKAYELSRYSRRVTEAINTILVDRFVGLVVLQGIALVALAFGHKLVSPGVTILTLLLFGGSLAVAWLLLNRRLWRWVGESLKALSGDKGESPLSSSSERGARPLWSALSQSKLAQQLQQLYESIHAYEARSIWKALSISFVFNIALIAMNYLIALALEVDIPIWYFLLFVPLTSIILMIPFSLGGLGIREAGYVALFAQAGVPDNVAFSMSLLIYAMTVVAGLIGGVIYAVRGAREYVTEEG